MGSLIHKPQEFLGNWESGPGGTNSEAATFFASRYNFPSAYQGTTLDGTGQTIAIIELGGGFRSSDLKLFFNAEWNPSVISISWGGPEDNTDQQGMNAFHELFVAAAAGIAICAASGDHGTADLDAQHWDGKIHVNHPAVELRSTTTIRMWLGTTARHST
jgi:subtilase family serine protease